jgi:hypothetical protein
VAIKILHTFPQVFHEDSDLPIIKQYVIKFHSLYKSCLMTFYSLLLRYALLHSIHSLIKINKVTYGGQINAGLECTKFILAATYILTADGSMSFDDFNTGIDGLSVILCDSRQLGLKNEHLILGPLRFANHECKSNCQVSFYYIYYILSDNIDVNKINQRLLCICSLFN